MPEAGVTVEPGRIEACRPEATTPTLGLVPASVQAISWRANRVQADASLDELRVVTRYVG
jgi:hypothetical protein